MSAPEPLAAEKLCATCDTDALTFDSTDELEALEGVVGHARALSALDYGIHVDDDGCNIYALGPTGLRKHDVIIRILEREAGDRPVSSDWCYVYNFGQPHKPNAVEMPPGRGRSFSRDMEQLIEDLGTAIPSAFETEEYQSRIEELEREFAARRDKMLEELGEEAARRHIRFLHTPTGFAFAPVDDQGDVINPDQFKRLSPERKKKVEADVEELQLRLQKIIRQFPIWQKETREKVKQIDREIAQFAVGHLIDGVRDDHRDLPEILEYLNQVEQDVIEHVREFRQESEPQALLFTRPAQDALRRYRVNVLVDHELESSSRVIYPDLPTYSNLVGRIEYQAQMGTLVTDFTMIKAGDLHRANGGYLVLDAERVLRQPFAWEGLKRALRSGVIRIEPLEKAYGLMSTISLEPEPIPLDVKVVLVGDRRIYYLLNKLDPEFADLFKVVADFNEEIERDADSTLRFARLIARIVAEKRLMPFGRDAVARVIEHSSRLAGDSKKLSVDLRSVTDLLTEANHLARHANHQRVGGEHVEAAIDARIYRHDRIRELSQESIARDLIKIDTAGEVPGQVNGLSVINLGDTIFGQPSRITATTRLGDGRFVDIQRETELGGSVHSKGVLILTNYLSARYARDHPLSVAASIVFEQSYGMVEGDSASVAELCALLSALADLPIRQSLAVTGSVNQRGEVQTVGGVNQKIEGFFDVCVARGLSGNQGVIIPASNVEHLMLRREVVDAAARGQFAVYPVDSADQAMELLTGVSAGRRDLKGEWTPDSINARVEQALIDLAQRRKSWGGSRGEGQDDD